MESFLKSYFVILLFCIQLSVQDLFTSTDRLNVFIHNETNLFDIMEKHLDQPEYEPIKTKLKAMRKRHQLPFEIAAHPVATYTLLRDWLELKALVRAHSDLPATLAELLPMSLLPKDEDRDGALEGIARLQMVYNLNTTYIENGMGDNVKLLNYKDMLALAKLSNRDRQFRLERNWYRAALRAASTDKEKAQVLQRRAKYHYENQQYASAQKCINEASELDPLNGEILLESETYQDKSPADSKDPENKVPNFLVSRYRLLCQGRKLIMNFLTARLRCRYRSPHLAYYRFKEETVCRDSRIMLYRDVVSDKEAETMINITKAQGMVRSLHGTNVKDMSRISQTGWLDDSNPIVARISKRIELITGLSTTLRKEASDAEKFQSQRQENPSITLKLYVMQSGGPTEPNLPLRNSGERVATFMIYLSEVAAGGATVFPHMTEVGIFPEKNAAVMWYNIKRDGVPDEHTLHAGCPVIKGSKWIANKWIRVNGQMFRRPCGMEATPVD